MLRLLPLLLPLGGCAATPPQPAVQAGDAVARELAGRVAGPAQSCVPASTSINSLHVVERWTILYRQGATIWVNRLPDDCPGFHPVDTLVVQVYGGRYCRDDRVHALNPGSSIPGPACALGEFIPYRQP